MRPPLTYYGGKIQILKYILPRIPDHRIYVEPFFGSGAVYWSKEPTQVEAINDIDAEVVNFYNVLKHRFADLKKMIDATLHCRKTHLDACLIYAYPHLFPEVRRAWAVWVLAHQSYCSKFDGGWGYSKVNPVCDTLSRKREAFASEMACRLESTQIECTDALRVIQAWDEEDAFIYLDPPYFSTHCGHYQGYTEADFRKLLEAISQLKAKFLLSNYPSAILEKFCSEQGWYTIAITRRVASSQKRKRLKTELLVANYPITDDEGTFKQSINASNPNPCK